MDTSKYIFENFISDVSLNEYDHKQRLINYKNNNTKSNISKAVFESIINSIYNDKDGIEKNISDLNLTVLNDGLNAENIGLLVGNLLLKIFLNKVLDKFESIQDDLNDTFIRVILYNEIIVASKNFGNNNGLLVNNNLHNIVPSLKKIDFLIFWLNIETSLNKIINNIDQINYPNNFGFNYRINYVVNSNWSIKTSIPDRKYKGTIYTIGDLAQLTPSEILGSNATYLNNLESLMNFVHSQNTNYSQQNQQQQTTQPNFIGTSSPPLVSITNKVQVIQIYQIIM